jgi:putative CRISPR-associated protein (TIGR02619 family)
MPISVISTVGNSVLRNASKSVQENAAQFAKQPTDLSKIIKGKHDFPGKPIYDQVMATLIASTDDRKALLTASAELNSLINIVEENNAASSRGNRFDFLVSQTPDGALSGRIIADFCSEYFTDVHVEVHVVEGLQVHDARLFKRSGSIDLISRIYRILKDTPNGTYTRIFNPTGGFKAAIPYLTLIGMLEDVRLHYIFERSEELLQLGHLPVRLSFDAIEVGFDTLVSLEANTLSETELKELLGVVNQSIQDHPAWALFDMIEDEELEPHYELSGLGQIALEFFKKRVKTLVSLSEQAISRYNSTDAGSRTKKTWKEMLDNIHDPVWRQKHRHEYIGSEFPACKMWRRPDRLFYSEQDDEVFILELAIEMDNGQYDRTPGPLTNYRPSYKWETEN